MLIKFIAILFFITSTSLLADTSLVVYNSNLGLVHESKKIQLEKGHQSVVYDDVASTVQTDSVNIVLPPEVTLYSQQYRFDQISLSKLLKAHINKKVKFKRDFKQDIGDKKYQIEEATLIAANGGNSVIKTLTEEIFSVPSAHIIFSDIPESLITKPSLVWNLEASQAINTSVSVDYLINQIGWESNYILNLSKNKADLTGWITVDNRSGKHFKEVDLNVLAGDINRAGSSVRPKMRRENMRAMVAMDSMAAPAVAHEGYHFYRIPFKVTLANNEKTQIKFIDEKKIPITRRYEANLSHPNYFRGQTKKSVSQFVEIESLEMPLPQGVVRSYSQLKETTLLLGENRIKHTPKHEKISLRLGTNFDLKVNEKVLENNDGKFSYDKLIEYEVVNRSHEKKVIELLVPFVKSNFSLKSNVATSQDFTWKNANLIKFEVMVDADSKHRFNVHFVSTK